MEIAESVVLLFLIVSGLAILWRIKSIDDEYYN